MARDMYERVLVRKIFRRPSPCGTERALPSIDITTQNIEIGFMGSGNFFCSLGKSVSSTVTRMDTFIVDHAAKRLGWESW
jgi:hypothetical protein